MILRGRLAEKEISRVIRQVKDRNGEVLTKIEDQLNRWKEHFQEILNRLAPENPTDLPKGPLLDIKTGQSPRQKSREL